MKYADDVKDLINYATPGKIAAFFAESIQGVGGFVEFPQGYLQHAYEHVRAAGGLDPQVIMGIVGALMNNAGGLSGILAKLQQGGLGDVAASPWRELGLAMVLCNDAASDVAGVLTGEAGVAVGADTGTEGMVTDPVYEGKSMAALIHVVETREIDPTSTVLFAHLGGQPALNGYSALFS